MNKEDINRGILESSEILKRTIKEIPEFELFGSKILKEKCIPFEEKEFGQREIKEMAKKMIDILKKYRKSNKIGNGLAANQIGINRSMIVALLEGELEVLINPEILELKGKGSYWECCLSSGAILIGKVIRPWQGRFEYRDVEGKKHILEADPMQTRLFLHEIDHLEGKTCVEKYEPGTMRFARGVEDIKSAGKLEKIE